MDPGVNCDSLATFLVDLGYIEDAQWKKKLQFSQPGPINGAKSKGKALMKMSKCTFTYHMNTVPTLCNNFVQVSLSSHVACVGENNTSSSWKVRTSPRPAMVGNKHPNVRIVNCHPLH